MNNCLTQTRFRRTVIGAAVIGVCVASQSAFATFGYYGYGYGTKSKGMGGAGVALSQDMLAGLTNPATLVHLAEGFELGATVFMPDRGYTANNDFSGPPFPHINPGDFDSDTGVFLIPSFANHWKLDERSSLTLTVAGNGGMNTDFDHPVFTNFTPPGAPAQFQATRPTGIDLAQLAVGLSYSIKVNENHSLGITPILAVQGFRADGLEPFRAVSIHQDSVTNNGRDWAYGGGVRVGWLGQLTPALSMGASYQSRLYMTEFDDYKGLFAEEGDFDIAPTWTIGIAWRATPDLTFAFDVQRYLFSEIAALSNPNDFPITPNSLGGDDGLGFGWDDQTAFKVGVAWDYSEDLTLRAGYSRGDQVVPDTQALFNIMAPAVVREHYTVGLTKQISEASDINFSLMVAPEEKVNGTNPNTGAQTGSIQMRQVEVELSWSYRY